MGDFDSRYFLYYEDMDYGLRLNAAGWGLECVPGARAWHRHGDVNSAGVQYLGVRNRLLMLREHAPVRFVARDVARLMVQIGGDLGARDAARSVRGRRAAIALRDFTLGRFGPPPQGLR